MIQIISTLLSTKTPEKLVFSNQVQQSTTQHFEIIDGVHRHGMEFLACKSFKSIHSIQDIQVQSPCSPVAMAKLAGS